MFELADHSGLPAGRIEVTLRWKLTYLPSAGSTMAAEEAGFTPEEKAAEDLADTTLRSIKETSVDKKEDGERRSSTSAAEVRCSDWGSCPCSCSAAG